MTSVHNGEETPMNTRSIMRTVALLGLLLLGGQGMRGQGRFGFGVVAGEPTGLAWKYRIDNVHAVAGAVGFLPGDYVRLNVDVLWQSPFRGIPELVAYYGPGLMVAYGQRRVYYISDGRYGLIDDGGAGGLRMVLGLAYTIPRSPVDLFFELAPALVLTSPAGGVVDFGLGVRVYP
jgi:hypothetical protein